MAPDSPGGENIILDVCGVRAISIFDQGSEVADAVFLAAGTDEIVVPVKRDDVVEGASNFLWEFSQWLSRMAGARIASRYLLSRASTLTRRTDTHRGYRRVSGQPVKERASRKLG